MRAAPPEHHAWIAERAGLSLHPGFGAIEAVDDSGRVLGMVGFDGWWPGAVAMHVAVDSPIALRRLVDPAFRVVFEGYHKSAATAQVLSTNKRSLRLVRRLGFRHVHTGQDYAGKGVDVEFFEMRRDEWAARYRRERKAA